MPGILHIKKDQIEGLFPCQPERGFAALGALGPAKSQLEGPGNRPASHGVIVHDQDLNGRMGEVRIGSRTADIQEQVQRRGGGLDIAWGPGLRALEQFLEHAFERRTQPERRVQSAC